jgi:TolB-like protein
LRYFFSGCVLDTERRELRRGADLVPLSPQVFDLLHYLIRNREHVVSKDDLIAAVWEGRITSDAALTTRLSVARSAIGDSGEEQRLIKTLPRKGLRFVGEVREQQEAETAVAGIAELLKPTLALPDKPSIAILPFTNMSDDREQEYFADGIAEDIITVLSRSRWFFVIARNSSFAFKGRVVDVKQVARELGVQYVLEGSVRKSAQRARITAQLIDASAGTHIWAERFDLELKEIFAVQDEITDRVAGAIEPELLKRESVRATARGNANLSAWDLVRQGTWHYHHVIRSGHLRARDLFREALKLDPQLPEAHMWLGRVNSSIVGWGWSDNQAADKREAVRSSIRGVLLDEKDPFGHYALAQSYHYSGAIEQAIQSAERALQISPTFALAHLALGTALLSAGDAAGSIEPLERGLRLKPFDPFNFHWLRSLALAFYFTGKPAAMTDLKVGDRVVIDVPKNSSEALEVQIGTAPKTPTK